MLYEIFLSLMGNWFRFAVEWLGENPVLTTVILGAWMLVFFAGRAQLNRLERRTKELALSYVKTALGENPKLNAKQLYKMLYPEWVDLVKRNAWFIPHRLELWPQPATPENAKEKLGFTPAWLNSFLKERGIDLGGSR